MDTDWLLIGLVIAAILYFSNYRVYGVLLGLLVLFIFVISVLFVGKPRKVESASNVLEPIVIESTRGAPYRIPESLEIWYEPKDSVGAQWEKRPKTFGKAVGRLIRAARGETKKKEEK